MGKNGSYSIYRMYGRKNNCRILVASFETSDACMRYLKYLQIMHPEVIFSTVFEVFYHALQKPDIDSQPSLPF